MSSRQLFASAVRTGVVTAGVALCLATTPSAQQQTARQITVPYQMFTLANGLTVILHRDTTVPIVSVNTWYHVGSANERPGRTGLHFLDQGVPGAAGAALARPLGVRRPAGLANIDGAVAGQGTLLIRRKTYSRPWATQGLSGHIVVAPPRGSVTLRARRHSFRGEGGGRYERS